jgi:H+-transporting ATPase
MITGDHLNIAVETSRLIGLGTGILPASDLWPASDTRDETIRNADGFAQVLPKDKREVILVLKSKYKQVVGMTGDGVNDAPALAEAQIGIAVDGATEAARSAADIILTEPGLSAIFDAVVESRKIFARLRAYVIYRMAATIQIVLVLSILIYGYDVVMNPLYVILLALFNDISMLPIADDTATPSSRPEIPSLPEILTASAIYGGLLTLQSVGIFEFAKNSNWLDDADKVCQRGGDCDYISALTYLQISIAIEFVIFSCRTPGFVLSPKYLWGDGRPSWPLFVGVMLANIIVTVCAGQNWIISKVKWADIGWIWLYNLVGLLVIDLLKVILSAIGLPLMSAGASFEVLGYPDLPTDVQGTGRSLLRSSINRSTMARSLGRQTPLGSRHGSFAGPSNSMESKKSPSLLPYPYNVRADVVEAAANGNLRSN